MKALLIRKIKDTRKEHWRIRLFIALINAVIVFLLSAIILRFIESNMLLALVPSIIYMVYEFFISSAESERALIELISSNNPHMREQIKTAYDNRKDTGRNIVLLSLSREASRMIDRTGVSSLMDSNKIVFKTVSAVFLSFILLTLNFMSLDVSSMSHLLDNEEINHLIDGIEDSTGFDMRDGLSGTGEKKEYAADDRYEDSLERPDIGSSHGGVIPGFDEGEIPDSGGGAGSTADEDIFGDPSTASIEGRNVEVKLHPEYGGNIELRDVNDEASGWEIPEKTLEGEASGMPDQDPVEYEEFIKRYFEAMQQEVSRH
ncbi:MAG: hypothetical protein U9M95_03385 [Candidatus Altiarchaeota archaeon]|nr:hypothetical protein [Candidatus Altiarchaeota archaeon]